MDQHNPKSMENEIKYTHEDFRAMKRDLKLTNADIGNIIGLTGDSVKNQTQSAKSLPAWALSMIYVWKRTRN